MTPSTLFSFSFQTVFDFSYVTTHPSNRFLYNIAELVIDNTRTSQANDCITLGYVLSIDKYNSQITFDGTAPFTPANTLNKCKLNVCVVIENSIVPAENTLLSDKFGCSEAEICFIDVCSQSGLAQTAGFTWSTSPVIIHVEYDPIISFASPLPYTVPTEACYDFMATGLPAQYTFPNAHTMLPSGLPS